MKRRQNRTPAPKWIAERQRRESERVFNELYAGKDKPEISTDAEIERRENARNLAGVTRLAQQAAYASDPLLAEGIELGAVITPCEPVYPPAVKSVETDKAWTGDTISHIDMPYHINTQKPLTPLLDFQRWNTHLTHGCKYGMDRVKWEQITFKPVQAVKSVELDAIPQQRPHSMNASDLELLRTAAMRDEYAESRLWYFARHLDTAGEGRVSTEVLFGHMWESGEITSKRTFNAILARGRGIYWTTGFSTDKNGILTDFIYLTGYKALSVRLFGDEYSKQAENVETNQPGNRRYYVDLSGSKETVLSRIYAAWIGMKCRKNGEVRISRARLCALWGVTVPTLLKWERLTGVQVTHVKAETNDTHDALIPEYAKLYLDNTGNEFTSWNGVNVYSAPIPEEYRHVGQGRKVRAAVNQTRDSVNPVYQCADGQVTKRTHFSDHHGKQWTPGYKALRQHLKQHQDTDTRRHYVLIGKRFGKHIEEMSSGNVFRKVAHEVDYHAMKNPAFQMHKSFVEEGYVYHV